MSFNEDHFALTFAGVYQRIPLKDGRCHLMWDNDEGGECDYPIGIFKSPALALAALKVHRDGVLAQSHS